MNYGDWEKTALDKPQGNALEQITIMANQTFDKVMNEPIPQMIIKEVNQKMDIIKKELHEDFQKIDAVGQAVMVKSKEKLNEWLKQKVELIILKIVDKMKPHLLNQMIDPCMCEFLKNFIRDIYEELWPDIRDQILIQVRMKFDNPYDKIQIIKPHTHCLCVPFAAIRSWYLYSIQPFNRSIFYRLKTFSWWFLFTIKMIPFYGIQSYIYLIVFLFIDKNDEYQLVQFIINFKSMQFISIGILGSIIGYFTFYGCTVANDLSLNYQECQTKGPTIFLNFYLDIIGYLLQIALTFIAFFLLPLSKVKGRIIVDKQKLNSSQENKNSCCCYKVDPSRGGRLKFFMVYDLMCFIACIGLFLALFYTDSEEWQYKASMYLVKTIYGVLSFPFLIFIIPGIIFIITRSHGTGYDQYGNCLPLIQDLKFYNTQQKKINKPYDPLYVIEKDDSMDIYEGLQLMEEIL